MLESLIASILNRFLGNYVSNLNYDQLNIGIWNGEANLRNLKLRREALDKLDLPIDVLEGYLGELTLSIPWSNLKGKPVKVSIENVYLLAVPKNEATISAEEEEQRAQMLKQRRLATAELLADSQTKQTDQTSGNNEGFISSLTTKIIDNLQVSIKNIHIRFEDNVSDPGHPFAAGITLKELSAVSTDGQWNPTFISEATNTIHKLATLHSLAVYWNTDSRSLAGFPHEEAARVYASLIPDGKTDIKEHQYILKPVSGTGKIKLNKQFGRDLPKTDITLLFDELGICLDDHQYRDAILLVDLFHDSIKKKKYLKFHPPPGVTPKSDPRAYLKFAGNAVLSEIHERNYKWTWDHFRKRRDQRRDYIECYIASKMNKATEEQEEKLKRLEWDLSFEDIRFYRSIAKSRLRREQIKIEQEQKKKESAGGWFSSWWFGTSNSSGADNQQAENGEGLVMTEEQKRELYEAIDYDEDKAAIAASVDMPKDTMKLAIETRLNRGSFNLLRYSHHGGPRELASLVYDTVTINAIQYVESMKFAASLGDVRLYDGMTPNTLYPQIIGVKKDGHNGIYSVERLPASSRKVSRNGKSSERMENEPFFQVTFDHKPLDHVADNAISLKMRHLEIVYNPAIVKGVLDFLKPPENKSESINALLEAASNTLEGFKQQTRAGLEYALQKHTTLALDIDMDAPIIIIPESCTVKHSAAMIIDAGHIQVDSDLANQELIKDFKSLEYDRDDYKKLEGLIYDKFKVQLSQTKLLITPDISHCTGELHSEGWENAQLIKRIDMSFLVEICIIQRATQFTKFKVSGEMPLLSLNISDTKYKTLMRMIDLVLEGISSDEDKPAEQTKGQNEPNVFIQNIWGNGREEDLVVPDTESEASVATSNLDATVISWPASDSASLSTAANMSYRQEQFRFKFEVGKVIASVRETAPESVSIENLLCEVVFDKFGLDFVSRPEDMEVSVSLKSLNVLDKMEHGNEFKYLVTSGGVDEQTQKDLVNVKYLQVKRTHPLFFDEYQGFNQTVSITLSTLNIVVTRSSILTLYNFVLSTFTSPSTPDDTKSPEEHDKSGYSVYSASGKERKSNGSADQLQSNTMKVTIHMDSVDLILNDDGRRLGTGVMSYGDLSVLLYPSTLKVTGKFGNFTLTDDSCSTDDHDVWHSASDRYVLSIEGEELADFSFETFDASSSEYPGYDQEFRLRMGALRLSFLESLKPTLDFLNEFLEMKAVYDAARQAAVEKAQQMQEANTKLHFDVVIKSPVVTFPIDASNSLVAYLGEIRAANMFGQKVRRRNDNIMAEPREVAVTTIQCGLYNIGLQSQSTISESDQSMPRQRLLPIIDNLDMTFNIESLDKAEPDYGPATSINGNISDVCMTVTEFQYEALLKVYGDIMSTFMASDEKNKDEVQVIEGTTSTSSVRHLAEQQREAVDKGAAENNGTAITMNMQVVVRTVRLDILTGQDLDLEDRFKQRLARLSFNNTEMKMQTKQDASMLLEVQMDSVTFEDTRSNTESKFREIMSASHLDGPQLQVQLKMPGRHQPQTMQASVTIDSPKIVLSLDYVFLLVDFLSKPFTPDSTTEAQAYAKSQRERHGDEGRRKSIGTASKQTRSVTSRKSKPAESSAMQLHYTFRVMDVQIICLAKPESNSSEAIVFSLSQLAAIQQQELQCNIDGIHMFLCRMDNPKESAVPFVEEFNVAANMKTSSTMPGCSVTMIDIDVQPLIIRLSYHDMMLVLAVINKAMELMGNGKSTSSASYESGDIAISAANGRFIQSSNADGEDVPNGDQAVQKIEPYIIMSKELLKAKMQGLQFILIEDLHDLPFIDVAIQPFTVNVSGWSRALAADVYFNIAASNFNFRNSHWEPIIEPWVFGIKVSQDAATKGISVDVESDELLNLNITHTFLETFLAVSTTLTQVEPLPESAQKQVRPYLIRNRSGYDLRFWNMSEDAVLDEKGTRDTRVYHLKDGEDYPWTFRDWKHRRMNVNVGKNLLGVEINALDWEALQNVVLDQEGQHVYRLRPDVNGVSHRLIVDIRLEEHVKKVTFRSGLGVKNQSKERLQLKLLDGKGCQASEIWTIAPEDEFSLPIGKSYDFWMTVRPSEHYEWSQPGIHWSDVMHPKGPRTVTCSALDGDKLDFIFQLHGVVDQQNPLTRQYPVMTLEFGAPIELENMLPYGFDYNLMDKTSGKICSGSVHKGETAFLHTIPAGHHVALSIKVHHSSYDTSDYTDIVLPEEKEASATLPLTFTDKDNNKLNLQMNVARLGKANNALWINVFSPYLILNKTNLTTVLRPRISHRQSKYPFYPIRSFEDRDHILPVMFSFAELDKRNRVQLAIPGAKWSEPLSFEAVGSVQDVVLPAQEHQHEVHVGVRVEEGTGLYHLSKLITISPRFVIKNNLDTAIRYREFDVSEASGVVHPGEKVPLYNLTKARLRWLCIQLEQEDQWSAPFDIQQIGDTHIKVFQSDGTQPLLVKVSIAIQDATLFIYLEREKTWPYIIFNDSSVPVTFFQEDTGLEEYRLKDRQKKALPPLRQFTLEPHSRMEYSWDMPVAQEKRLILNVMGRKRSVNFQAIGTQVPFKYQKSSLGGQYPGIMSIDVFAHETSLILVLTDFNPNTSPFRPKQSASSTFGSSSREGSTFETVDYDHIVNFAFGVKLAGVGISVINKRAQEMLFATIKGLDFKYTDSSMYQSIRTSIRWLQIDNQFHSAVYPIICYPTTLPKNATEQQTHPTFHLALDLVKDEAHGVYNFKLFSLLLQEMTFEIDEDFLFGLVEFAQFSATEEKQLKEDPKVFAKEVAEPTRPETPATYYFQEFCIQPMRINLSFVRTDRVNAVETDDETTKSPFRYIFDVFTMAIGNINDAPIKLNALIVENLRASWNDLVSRVRLHYQDQIWFQVHRVLGSADFIGNPIGLFSTLSSGVGELFYEPYQGFVMSDRPQDLGIGIARGVGGFLKKGVFGVTDSLSKITGSVGKGLAAATMDKKFQDRRRISMTRNKPRHAMYGVTQGVTYLGTSVASGVVGLVKRPIEGAEEGGVLGFASGVGRGVIGLVTKPVVGMFDLASNITAGVRETTTIFDTSDIARERLPRHIGMDGILRPFSQREALGQFWLKDLEGGKYFHDTYVAHCTVQSDDEIALLSYQRVFLMRAQNLEVDWTEKLDQIQSCKYSIDGVMLHIKAPARTRAIPIKEESSRKWFAQQVQIVLRLRKEEKERQ